MRLVLLVVVVALAVAGSTLAKETRVCSVKLNGTDEMYLKVNDMAHRCLVLEGTQMNNLTKSTEIEEIRAFFKSYCEKRPHIHTCLDEVALSSESCQNETRHQLFLVHKDLLESVFETGCHEDGKLFATIFNGKEIFHRNLNNRDPEVLKCLINTNAIFEVFNKNQEFDRTSNAYLLYQEGIKMRECVRVHQTGESEYKNSIDTFLGSIIDKMKCINPQDKSRVLCKTLDLEVVRANYCPIRIQQDDPRSMNELITGHLEKCLKRSDPEEDTFDNITNLAGYSTYYQRMCEKNTIEPCLNNAILLSTFCLNETQYQMFTLLADIVKAGLEYGCMKDGEPLAILTNKFLQVGNDTSLHLGCFRAAKSSLDAIHAEGPHSKSLEFYKVLRSFQDCIIGELHGDNRAVFYAQFMLNRMLKELTCTDPVSGARVECKTLDSTQDSGNKTCQYEPRWEDDSVSYSMFLDMGLQCLSLEELDIPELHNFSDGEFKYFVNHYCRKETRISNCLRGVAATSDTCEIGDEPDLYGVYIHTMDNFLKTGCSGDAEILTSVVKAVGRYNDSTHSCIDAAADRLETIFKKFGNATTISMETFKTMNDFKNCFSNAIPDEEIKAVSTNFLAQIPQWLKCVNYDKTIVPCGTVANNVTTD